MYTSQTSAQMHKDFQHRNDTISPKKKINMSWLKKKVYKLKCSLYSAVTTHPVDLNHIIIQNKVTAQPHGPESFLTLTDSHLNDDDNSREPSQAKKVGFDQSLKEGRSAAMYKPTNIEPTTTTTLFHDPFCN